MSSSPQKRGTVLTANSIKYRTIPGEEGPEVGAANHLRRDEELQGHPRNDVTALRCDWWGGCENRPIRERVIVFVRIRDAAQWLEGFVSV